MLLLAHYFILQGEVVMNEKQCGKPHSLQPRQSEPEPTAYALYDQTNLLNNRVPFGGVILSETSAETEGRFCSDGNFFQIVKPGVYLVSYIINIPASVAVNTIFMLQQNKQNVAGTVRPVAKTATDTPHTVTAQTILAVQRPTTLQLVSSSLLTISGAATETLATLLFQQLV